jgi:UDP-N-acetylmuramoyl-tripeptide--D-alanyl-D-alanine ligase
MFKSLLRLWTGPLPDRELFPDRQINPLLHWFIHPVKRHLAKFYLLFLQGFYNLTVIGLTGSTGKTTTANMLYTILSLAGSSIKTADSVTSTYNLPTTILKCTPATRYLVLEMGVEYPGDMDFYTWLVKPDIGLILNISPVHSSFLGSVKNIAVEKNKLLLRSRAGVVNGDDAGIISDSPATIYKFGYKNGYLVQIKDSSITSDLHTRVQLLVNKLPLSANLPFLGSHFTQNAAAASAVCSLLQIPPDTIKSGLEITPHPAHRLHPIRLKNGSVIIDDTYNANPLAVTESLNVLSQVAEAQSLTPVFVFGQMNELGRYEQSSHEDIGRLVKKLGIREFYCLGPAAQFSIRTAGYGQYFDDIDSLTAAVTNLNFNNRKSLVLIKGSHSWHLENLVFKLVNLYHEVK